jgi:hypothetical protein
MIKAIAPQEAALLHLYGGDTYQFLLSVRLARTARLHQRVERQLLWQYCHFSEALSKIESQVKEIHK